ncbi:hypothetical protein ACHAXT_010600 [Thalassiosira profunda]
MPSSSLLFALLSSALAPLGVARAYGTSGGGGAMPPPVRRLPSSPAAPIIIGYAHDAKSGKAARAIEDGAGVIIWSFVHMKLDGEKGMIETALDLEEIRIIRDKYEQVVHLAAFGGWNGPHPPGKLSGKEWCEVFVEFNQSRGYLFHGIDWDYEGHDDLQSPTAHFTLETLDVMADFSVEAKRRGMIVSMAPAESYLDATAKPESIDATFSLALDLPPRAWASDRYHATDEDRALVKARGFSHAGRQCYAYVLAKAGISTFDWISIQLYEAYSPFAHDVHRRKLDQNEALMMRIRRLVEGYTVTELPLTTSEYEVKIPPSKLVLGVANGWADGLKFCKVDPSAIRSAYQSTRESYEEGFLGVMFWTIEEEGREGGAKLTDALSREFWTLDHSGEL